MSFSVILPLLGCFLFGGLITTKLLFGIPRTRDDVKMYSIKFGKCKVEFYGPILLQGIVQWFLFGFRFILPNIDISDILLSIMGNLILFFSFTFSNLKFTKNE